MELSKEQQIAFDKYVQGKNIFITGPGGSGKSALIRLINEHAYKKFKDILDKNIRFKLFLIKFLIRIKFLTLFS
jgi:DNA replication protein DnaC